MPSTNSEAINELPELVRQLYAIVKKLEDNHKGRRFTLDGHLVGSLGEVLAEYHYDLELLPPSAETHDAKATDGRLVQIKATQRSSVALSSKPDYLLVLKLHEDGSWDEVYNGPGDVPWEQTGKRQKNGQQAISVTKLKRLAEAVPDEMRFKRRS